MQIKIQRWEDSAAIRLPAVLLRQLQLGVGSTLSLSVEGRSLILKAVRGSPRYSLEELMTECDPLAPEPEDIAIWHCLPAVGREV